MSCIKHFTHLKVWQEAHRLAAEVYRTTARFPADEKYGLRSQIRRAAVSVSANIAEGFKRKDRRDKLRFYNIAAASLDELEAELYLVKELGFMGSVEVDALLDLSRSISYLLYRWTQF